MNDVQNQLVKSCQRLESGLRFGPEGLRACQFGAIASPIYWEAGEAGGLTITKKMVIEKRQWLLDQLNDPTTDISCKHCDMVVEKTRQEIDLTKLGQIDLATTSACNLRCNYCGFTAENNFVAAQFDDLAILKEFDLEDVQWDSVVDFNGGEPVLLTNLSEYIDYFVEHRIRIRFMTNGVRYSQAVYDGLVNGTMQWVCTSVDAGTPSTYFKMKARDRFSQVLENLARYAHAGQQGGGRLAIKYIFTADNCGDDDILGFLYACLAIKPHQVWLTFNFSVFEGDYDYSEEIKAYAKMFGLFRRHGIEPVHYSVGHLALISQKGKSMFERVLSAIKEDEKKNQILPHLAREVVVDGKVLPPGIKILNPDQRGFSRNGSNVDFNGSTNRILLAPPCPQSIALIKTEFLSQKIIGFIDRDPMVKGKRINGLPIFSYGEAVELGADLVIVASPPQHRADIYHQLSEQFGDADKIVVQVD